MSSTATFALVIGIDKYRENSTEITNLSGCVADAQDMANFLSETFNADITRLFNENATAGGITAAFESLATNPDIPHDANIVIFYAGHGSEVSAPKSWSLPDHRKIQLLVPHDFEPGSNSDRIAKNALVDIKLRQLLEDIASNKGNNITVIFDSCHSGSGTRDVGGTRGVTLPKGTTLDPGAFLTSRGLKPAENKALGSHVLLAACTQSQRARETDGRGAFTSALMTLLRSPNLDLRKLTYSDAIERLPPLPNQDPQCEGINNDHIIFYNHAAGPRRKPYDLIWKKNPSGGKDFIIEVGEEVGISEGAEFGVYESNTKVPMESLVGRLVVRSTTIGQSTLHRVEGDESFQIPPSAFVLETRMGTAQVLRIFIEDLQVANIFAQKQQEMIQHSPWRPSFKVVATRNEKPDLLVTTSGTTARFTITDQICRAAGLNVIPHSLKMDGETTGAALRGIADFYWNLNRTPSGARSIHPKIVLECYELEYRPFGSIDGMEPIDTNANRCIGGLIQIDISGEERYYGFCIKNIAKVPLYVSVFYFDMSDLSIASYYQPPSAAHNGHLNSLQPSGSLTIGYGSDGSPPFTFSVDNGLNIDVGYVKLFLSTEHVDYSDIPQKSPFSQDRGSHQGFPKRHLWDTIKFPIVMRKT